MADWLLFLRADVVPRTTWLRAGFGGLIPTDFAGAELRRWPLAPPHSSNPRYDDMKGNSTLT
jgi:hypothetical protein